MNLLEINARIRQRPPFQMIERVTALEPGKSADGIKCVSVNEPYFQGHMPGLPIMPGVLLIESAAQLCSLVIEADGSDDSKVYVLLKVRDFKFVRPRRARRPAGDPCRDGARRRGSLHVRRDDLLRRRRARQGRADVHGRGAGFHLRMRVLVLNASPKGEQSHTMAITRAFLSGFPEGTQTELLELRHLNIRPCTGCLGCWTKTPGRCVQRDDMDRVYAAIAAADVIVESFPLYFYGIPGTLKTLTDRCLPYTKAYGWSSRAVHELRDPAMLEKRLVLISTCWHTGIDRLYAAVRTAYAEYAPGYQAIFCPQGELFAIDACHRQVNAYLADAAQAGREVAQSGRIADDTAARLARPILSDATFERITRPHWSIIDE